MQARTANDPLLVYVVGGGMEYIRMFFNHGFRGAKGVDDADLICFTGGADVDPSLYSEKALSYTSSNLARDYREAEIFGECLAAEKPMVGICRGGQLLNVLNGGKMWQHVTDHAIHGTHKCIDIASGKPFEVTSTHHQMMRPHDDGLVLAAANLSQLKLSYGTEYNRTDQEVLDDIEAVWYSGTKSLCFQPHPEFGGYGECTQLFFDYVNQYILDPLKKGN